MANWSKIAAVALIIVLTVTILLYKTIPLYKHGNDVASPRSSSTDLHPIPPRPRRGARGEPDPDGLTKTVVIYAYHCKVNSTREIENLRFLFDHGDMSAVTMILVSNGSDVPNFVPQSIYTLKRENKGYDFEAWYHGLLLARTIRKFDKFVFLNSSCKGPYLPRWFGVSNMHWTECFTRLIDDKTKLVGLTVNNEGHGEPAFYAKHIQSMMWATDMIGIELLLENKILEDNNTRSWDDTIVQKEIGMSTLFIEKGFNIVSLGMSDYINNTHGDIHYNNKWFGDTLNPLETIFYKNNRLSSKYIDYLDLCHQNIMQAGA